ncbi:LPXTG cell wall anchor domain-containing protein [Lactiplantibacillus sp. WILCCON 0030]|uniref:LPXTG cell wall anchor domain-containing protein n=1 Tax=Lactiplantibacillus brownii TaxID=3069269 RepID=A0ABU1ADA8_9LACO|nr:LPXTG cell wall anchor domain-containing protein [Lactiplantibacillus brownii]MDQ7938300.1 LPXTG cell wall anchor domain-containing protein [Lactiplantibacillus brownii]
MKKIILIIGLGLIGIFGLMRPVQAAANGQTTGQVSFYQGATTRINRQSLVIDRQIPNGETATPAMIATTHSEGAGTEQVARIPGWLKTTNSQLQLPQTDEVKTTYWLILGIMLLLVVGLVKLIQQTQRGEAASHVGR